jgi:hypothetical protein
MNGTLDISVSKERQQVIEIAHNAMPAALICAVLHGCAKFAKSQIQVLGVPVAHPFIRRIPSQITALFGKVQILQRRVKLRRFTACEFSSGHRFS